DWIEAKAMKKSTQIEKYGYLGLFLFVAVPLPGTGAWTGSLLAVLFGLKPAKSLLFIFLGVLTAGFVISALSFGLIQNILY
ncbi:MAG: COG2426 family protein, partial [Candidatus Ornithomonoglobus sp.]